MSQIAQGSHKAALTGGSTKTSTNFETVYPGLEEKT